MEAGGEFLRQRVVDGPVPRQTGKRGESGRPDPDGIMSLTPGGCACMPMVEMRLVHYLQLDGGKSSNKCCPNALRARCQFLRH